MYQAHALSEMNSLLLGFFYGFIAGVILGKIAIIGYYVVMKVILEK